jgi:Zn-finger nucleic acid-binding protein
VKVDHVEVDHCEDCGGLWLDQSELPRLLELKAAQVRELRRGQARTGVNSLKGKCPRCATELLRVASALSRQVTVDKCPDCGGVWLDGGEFDALFSAET